MKLHNLTPSKGSVKKRKRIARGAGAGTGGTATRGHKGAKSRSGYSSKRAHEGGQMPLQMRLPKRGFKNSHRRYKSTRPADYKAVSLTQLSEFATKHNLKEITPAALAEVGVISKAYKVLASGELSSALEVTANKFSKTAKKAITDAGGKAYVEVKLSTVQGVAKEAGVDTVDVALLAKHVKTVEDDDCIHVVAEGAVSSKLNLSVHKISDEAKALVEAQGGSVALV